MKFHLASLGLLSISVLSPLIPAMTSPASAACAMTDVGVQVAVRGSHDPTQQMNNSTMESGEQCLGNVTTNVGTQLYVGPGSVDQVRNSYQYVGGEANSYPNGYPGFNTPVIGVPVGVPVDVYAPAYDPSFYGNLPYAGSDYYPGYGTN